MVQEKKTPTENQCCNSLPYIVPATAAWFLKLPRKRTCARISHSLLRPSSLLPSPLPLHLVGELPLIPASKHDTDDADIPTATTSLLLLHSVISEHCFAPLSSCQCQPHPHHQSTSTSASATLPLCPTSLALVKTLLKVMLGLHLHSLLSMELAEALVSHVYTHRCEKQVFSSHLLHVF